MSTSFPSISPDYGAQKASTPHTKVVQFNDGYEKRLSFGLNQNPKNWTLSFANITEAESDTIETFLDDRAKDAASFSWTPPGSSVAYKWVCETWSKEIPYANRATIKASFRQVFE